MICMRTSFIFAFVFEYFRARFRKVIRSVWTREAATVEA